MWFTLLICYFVATQPVRFLPASLTSAYVPPHSRSAPEVCLTSNFASPSPVEYLGECTIRVTVLLEYLDHTFSICGCLLDYHSLIFLLFFGKGYSLCLLHLHNNFQLIPPHSLCDIGGIETLDFFITQDRSCNFYQGRVKLHISVVSYPIDF